MFGEYLFRQTKRQNVLKRTVLFVRPTRSANMFAQCGHILVCFYKKCSNLHRYVGDIIITVIRISGAHELHLKKFIPFVSSEFVF